MKYLKGTVQATRNGQPLSGQLKGGGKIATPPIDVKHAENAIGTEPEAPVFTSKTRYGLDFHFKAPRGVARVEVPDLVDPSEPATVELFVTPRSISEGWMNSRIFVVSLPDAQDCILRRPDVPVVDFKLLSNDPLDPNFARPHVKPDGLLAGAIAPGPAPEAGDWFMRLQTRWLKGGKIEER